MKSIFITLCLALTTLSAQAGDQIERMTADKMLSYKAANITWKDESLLPKGAKSALILGDPSKPGVFIAWLKFPPQLPYPGTYPPLHRSHHRAQGQTWQWYGRSPG